MTLFMALAINLGLAAWSLFLWFYKPGLWQDQALPYSVLTGLLLGCLILGSLCIVMIAQPKTGSGKLLLNALLHTLCIGAQGYILMRLGQQWGFWAYLKMILQLP